MRLSSLAIGAGAIIALGMLWGCADDSGMQQLNQNEFVLRGMLASDRQQIDSLQNQVKRLEDEIDEMKHNAAADTGAPSGDQDEKIARLESEISAMQAAMPTVPPAPAVGTDTTAPGAPPATAPGTPGSGFGPEAAVENAITWPQDLDKEIASAQDSTEPGAKVYRDGLNAMKAGNYPPAIVKFAGLQHRYPKSPLSEPAQYFTANAFYEEGKLEQSILQFNDLVMRFPGGRFTCQSLLREGQAFMKMNDKIDARLTLQKLTAGENCSGEEAAATAMLRTLASD